MRTSGNDVVHANTIIDARRTHPNRLHVSCGERKSSGQGKRETMDPENDNESARPRRKSGERVDLSRPSSDVRAALNSSIIKENYHRADFPGEIMQISLSIFRRRYTFRVNEKEIAPSIMYLADVIHDRFNCESTRGLFASTFIRLRGKF